MIGNELLSQIRRAKTPLIAAIYIRALATHHAASLICNSDSDRISIIEKAEQLAQSLERDWDTSEDGPKPWRRWIAEAGY